MSQAPEKEIVDITDIQGRHTAASNQVNALYIGFHALSTDYSYHIENTYGGHKIDELRDNTLYRLFSSLFHCELLIREHNIIEQRLSAMLKNNPENILRWVYPKNPNYEYAERQVSAILDSVVFHIASIFDYMAILITFLSLKNKDQTLMWGQVANHARNPNGELHQKPVSMIIALIDKEFVSSLYDHRSELIHRRADIMENSFLIKPATGKFTARFICSTRVRKNFKIFGNPDKDYTVTYFAYWILHTISNTIAAILRSLRKDITSNPPFSRHNFERDPSKPILLLVDPQTGKAGNPSATAWANFELVFPAPEINYTKENIKSSIPALFAFTDYPNFPWKKIDDLFAAKLEQRSILANGNTITVETTIFDIIIAAKKKDESAIGFVCYINKLFRDLSLLLTEEEKLLVHRNVKSMLTTLDTRFYNYVGEIGILYNLLSTGHYRLLRIEEELPNRKNIDFTLQNTRTSTPVLVEVLNIRLDGNRVDPDPEAIKKFLTTRCETKIADKNKHLTEPIDFSLVPVLWGASADVKVYSEFFQNHQLTIKETSEPFAWMQFVYGNNEYGHNFTRVSKVFIDPRQPSDTSTNIDNTTHPSNT
jgi:hypothetical protein